MQTAPVITIPPSLLGEREFVLVPRREYESLKTRVVPEIEVTARQRRAFAASEKQLIAGKYYTLDELERKMGRTRPRARA